jgi:transcriptional regulator with PAS, ATPase and Fis domain
MMKTIGIVTDSRFKYGRSSRIGEELQRNVLAVFGDHVTVNTYFMDTLTQRASIKDDLIMLMAGSRGTQVRKFVLHPENIIIVKRTFVKEKIYPLFSIPEGTDVLVVNDNIETVLDSISSLYHIGVKHVNLIPFEAGKSYPKINYAITPSERELVPPSVEHIYDVGNRVVDIPTMLQISSILHISDAATRHRLYNYNLEIFSPNEGIIENYNNLLSRTEEMDQLLELSHDGILLTDADGKIHIHNKRFMEIFDLSEPPIGRYLHEILETVPLRDHYHETFHDGLVTYRNRIINLEKRNIRHFNQESRMYFSFQEVTHIKKLEQNLTKKLRKRGQIARYTFDDIFSASPQMQIIFEKAKKIARTDLTVLITGETGTGKEILAQAIHNASGRNLQPFLAVNCAAIPPDLIESEFFGYAAGSFTGALRGGKQGLFEQANNGTVFLDEIGDMPNHLQSKLLRVLQERQVTPIGSDHTIDIDIRVVAATHKSPFEMLEERTFRKDLFYRLNVFPLELPSLRERREDIPFLLRRFADGRFTCAEECLAVLVDYDWPGNVRELINVVQYLATAGSSVAGVEALPRYILESFRVSTDRGGTAPLPNDLFLLGQRCDLERAISVLRTIDTLNMIGTTAGRKHITEYLSAAGLMITESPLRRILTILTEMGLISVSRGRKGPELTGRGRSCLSAYSRIGE